MKVTEYDDITQKLEYTHASHSNSTQKKTAMVTLDMNLFKANLGIKVDCFHFVFSFCKSHYRSEVRLKLVWPLYEKCSLLLFQTVIKFAADFNNKGPVQSH